VPFKSLGAVSYSPSIVTLAVSVAVCETFSAKEWYDFENSVRVRSKSLEMAPVDRSHTSSRFLFAFHSNYGDILYRLQDIAIYWHKIVKFLYPTLVKERYIVSYRISRYECCIVSYRNGDNSSPNTDDIPRFSSPSFMSAISRANRCRRRQQRE